MKISEVIIKLIEFNKTGRDVYVDLYERDNEGRVISKKRYPISAVFSHEHEQAKIYIEKSEGKDIDCVLIDEG